MIMRHHECVKRVKVKCVRIVWILTLAIGGIAAIVFINDTSRAYNDILESMKRYAENNPNLVINRPNEVHSGLESNATNLKVEVTRDSAEKLTAIPPVSN